MAIGATVSIAAVGAIGLTIWGVTRNKNKNSNPGDGEQTGNPGNSEQNSDEKSNQEKIAQKNLEIIHKKFDDFYVGNEEASKKAKEIFDNVRFRINKDTVFENKEGDILTFKHREKNLDYFADIINGKIELSGKNINDIMIQKPLPGDDFALSIFIEDEGYIEFGYDSQNNVFHG